MTWILFIDESGQDHRESPYEVLGGVAVLDARVWPLITAVQEAEVLHFGDRLATFGLEIKAKKLLKTKTFRQATEPSIDPNERRNLALQALQEGVQAKGEQRAARQTRQQLSALAQAKIAFCGRVLELCSQNQAKVFASIIAPRAPAPAAALLRKDYVYLFERFYHFLDDKPAHEHGIIVFDELERSQSHILVRQMSEYFQKTKKGRMRASRVLPEPMFVHSDLTTMIQIADILVYVISWGVRIKGMDSPPRENLADLAQAVKDLRYRTHVSGDDGHFERWSFSYIDDLRPSHEREIPDK